MKEHTRPQQHSAGVEPWPATESRWPIATWMSPWAFDDEGSVADEGDLAEGRDELRH